MNKNKILTIVHSLVVICSLFVVSLIISSVLAQAQSADSEGELTKISVNNFVQSLFEGFDYSPYIQGAIPENAEDKGFIEMPGPAKDIIMAKSKMGKKYAKSELPRIRNSRGEEVLSEIVIYDAGVSNSPILRTPKTNLSHGETIDLEMTFPGRFNTLKLKSLKYDSNKSIKIEDLRNDSISLQGKRNMKVYAMNFEDLNFTSGDYYDVAEGRELWKCKDWNFDSQTCFGSWQKIMDLIPGQEYSFQVSAVDPAYVEVFDLNSSIDVGIAALGEEQIVIAWVDSDTSNYVSFEIWNTRGIRLVDEVNIDTTGDTGSAVSVSSVNSTHFIIGWIDGPSNSLNHTGYTISGSRYINSAAIDATAGTIADVDVCQLGSRYVVASAGDDDADADFWIRNNANGASLVGETAVDTTMTPSANNQNLVSCSVVNSSMWAYAYFDDADNDASVFLRNESGAAVGAVLDIDTNVGETGQVAVAGMRNNRYAYVFYDSNVSIVYRTVRNRVGAAHGTVLANTAVDANAGNDSRVAVAELEFSGSSYFVAAWFDQSDTTIKAGVYDNSGAQITAPFTITSTPSTSFPIVSVAGTYSALGFGLCNATFAIAYANSSGNAVFETYWYNGTRWNGSCPGFGDTTAPNLTILYPANNTVNDSSISIDFIYNVTDASAFVNCSLYINDTFNQTTNVVSQGIAQNFSVEFENGNYTWQIACSDELGNSNVSGLYNLAVNVNFYSNNALDIDIDAMGLETLVMSWVSGDNNYISFEVWDTNGTRLVNQMDVDTSGDTGSAVAVSSVNSSHFVLGWIDSPLNDMRQVGYTVDGSVYIANAAVDADVGAFADVDVCQLGDRYILADANIADSDADFWTRNNANGAALVAETAVDGTVTPAANNQNLVSCSVINSSMWAYAYFDDADKDASVFLRTFAGAAVGAVLDIDANVGETGQVAVAGLRNNRYAYVFYDSNDSGVYRSVRGYAGAAHTTILGNTLVDDDAGNDSRVSVAEVEFSGQSYFVVAWFDNNDTTIKAGVYDDSGAEITSPFNVSIAPNADAKMVSLTGTHSELGFGLCDGAFAIAYTNSSGTAVFRTYWYNGTSWNGTCPDYDAPNISIISPANNTFNKSTQIISFVYNATDRSEISNCTLYINDAVNLTDDSIFKSELSNFTVNFSNGNYTWKIGCVDEWGNSNNTSVYNLNVSWYVPIIEQITAEALIILNAGGIKKVDCNATITEGNGLSDISVVNATIFLVNMTENSPNNNNVHYTNSSCTSISSQENTSNYTCSFYMYYYASNGTWNCSVRAYDLDGWMANNVTQTDVDTLYALNLSSLEMNYGDISPGTNSSDINMSITNFGNMPINISVYGFGGDNLTTGSGYAMMCLSGDNITIDNQRYYESAGRPLAQKKQLSSTPQHLNFTIQKQTVPAVQKINSSYWQLNVPPMPSATQCNGTIVFKAESP